MARAGMTQKAVRDHINSARKSAESANEARAAIASGVIADAGVIKLLEGAAAKYEEDVNYIARKLLSATTKNMTDSLESVVKFVEANISVFPAK